MIQIIPPNQFKTIPWKNGKGQTTELAISKNGTIDNFDWRLSIASVVEDGAFSDFTGYDRNLILLEGNGIQLTHDNQKIDSLVNSLSVSSFDGASKTIGKLINGPITDFNLMAKQGMYDVKVETFIEQTEIQLSKSELVFIYSNQSKIMINSKSEKHEIPRGHLVLLIKETEVKVMSKGMILIQLTKTKKQ